LQHNRIDGVTKSMKPAVADYQFRILCMRIVPVVGDTIYLVDHPTDITMNGHVYLSTSGYEFTGYSATAGFSPATIDLEGIAGASGITRLAVSNGAFDGARCYVFATSWKNPVEDNEPITSGIFGKAVLLDDRYQINGAALVDVLGQSIGMTYGSLCHKTFGSQGFAGCKVSLASNTVTGTLTSVTSAKVFRDSNRLEPADTFGAGTVQFTSGNNAGLKPHEIKFHDATGEVETYESFPYLPEVGDSYTMIRGCRKRLQDCKNRLGGSNVVNFGGFSYIPNGSVYAQVGQGG